jgi:CRP-like cAMP-binding protein
VTEPATLGALAGHEFLGELSEQHRARLASGAKPFRAAAGEYLAQEGGPAHAFYLIRSGQVTISTHLSKRGVAPLQTLGPGDPLGWSWLLPPYLWQFDARAQGEVQGLAFDAAWLRDQCERDPRLGYSLLKQLLAAVSRRLAACRIHHLDIYKG